MNQVEGLGGLKRVNLEVREMGEGEEDRGDDEGLVA